MDSLPFDWAPFNILGMCTLTSSTGTYTRLSHWQRVILWHFHHHFHATSIVLCSSLSSSCHYCCRPHYWQTAQWSWMTTVQHPAITILNLVCVKAHEIQVIFWLYKMACTNYQPIVTWLNVCLFVVVQSQFTGVNLSFKFTVVNAGHVYSKYLVFCLQAVGGSYSLQWEFTSRM